MSEQPSRPECLNIVTLLCYNIWADDNKWAIGSMTAVYIVLLSLLFSICKFTV